MCIISLCFLSMCILSLGLLMNVLLQKLHCRWVTYCHDIRGLLDAMELMEGEKKEDFYEVRENMINNCHI